MLSSLFDFEAIERSRRVAHRGQVPRRRQRDYRRLVVRITACLPVGVAIGLGSHFEPWVLMWIVAFAIYAACKAITFGDAYLAGDLRLDRRGLGYLLGWPGMDPQPFGKTNGAIRAASRVGATSGGAHLAAGLVILYLVIPRLQTAPALLIGWLGMIALIMTLHFGVFRILVAAWQTAGCHVKPVMDAPLRATNLADFWSRRWNHAFNVLAHRWVFAPVAKRTRTGLALLASFAFSGFVHELVITVPIGSDFGKPTAYFLLQAAGVMIARSRRGRRLRINRGLRGWLFTAVVVIAPVGLCFPPTFVEQVILPLLDVIRATPANL